MKKKKKSILPASKIKKMIEIDKRTKRLGLCAIVVVISFVSCLFYDSYRHQLIYDSLDISFKEVKEIEYGTANYNPLSLIESTNEGAITTVKQDIDTTKVGTQEVVFEVAKDGITKEIKVEVEVKDTNAPTVTLKEEELTITEGEELDLTSNIEKVTDVVDGDLTYSDKEEVKAPNYTVESDFDNSKPGEYTVTVKATDSNGNISETTYKVKVAEKSKPVVQNNTQNVTTENEVYMTTPGKNY